MKKLALIGTVALAVIGTVIFEKGVFTLPTSASPAVAFKDVPSDYWAKDAIQTAVDNGYVVGKTEGIFDPESSVTRAEFIKMIVTAEKLPVSGQTTGKDWYGPYVNAAVQKGIHAWSDFTSGDWNTPLTRAELARLAVRGTGTDNTDDKKWLYLAAKAGLIQGMDNTGTLAEDGTTTRAQSVTIIERILAVKRGETLPADKHAVNRAEVAWHGTNIFTMWPRYVNEKDIDKLKVRDQHWDSSDGIYHEEVVEFVVVDMEDPNDPFRHEVEGMPFAFRISGTNQYENKTAPSNSYVTYSKVKQVINGRYPKNLYVADGGYITISPIVNRSIYDRNYTDDYRNAIATLESSTGEIQGSHYSEGQVYVEWNIGQGNNPYYIKNLPSDGGTFYWVRGQVHPKGDQYSLNQVSIAFTYQPNLRYSKTYGPAGPSSSFFTAYPDYSKSN